MWAFKAHAVPEESKGLSALAGQQAQLVLRVQRDLPGLLEKLARRVSKALSDLLAPQVLAVQPDLQVHSVLQVQQVPQDQLGQPRRLLGLPAPPDLLELQGLPAQPDQQVPLLLLQVRQVLKDRPAPLAPNRR